MIGGPRGGGRATAVEVGADHEASSRRTAELLARAIRESGGERFALVIPGGSTPGRLFELLAEGYPAPLPWERIHLFWTDERCVPPDQPESNYGGARRLLIGRVPIPEANVHRMAGERGPAEGTGAYRRDLAAFFEADLPAFDAAVLGLGRDGHTCSLFPGSPALVSPRPVEPARSPAGVTERITLTPAAFREARLVLFLATGPEKSDAVARTLEGGGGDQEFPARAIRPDHGRTLWLLDRAAAAGLKAVPGAERRPP